MKRRDFAKMMGAAAFVPGLEPIAGWSAPEGGESGPRAWSIVAELAECCSCAIPCPCNFGRPEAGFACHGNRLYRIREGQIDGDDLAGAAFVLTFHRTVWTRLYLDEAMDPTQAAALDRVLDTAFGGLTGSARSRERVPLTVREGTDWFAFSVPASTVEMRLLPGLDGAPIRISGLPNSAYQEYVQYESVVHTHDGPDAQWSYDGTNGFRSVLRASG